MEITGKIFQILDEQGGTSASGTAWKKQEFIVDTTENPQYPRKVCFTLFGDRMSNLQGLSVNDEVRVSFEIESREYQGRWFHNINAWRVDKVITGSASASTAPAAPNFAQAPTSPAQNAEEEDGDLPF
ncbi:MAG: DUF3127 domain-containing protein [Mangrovibacterium sp.]